MTHEHEIKTNKYNKINENKIKRKTKKGRITLTSRNKVV